MPAEADCSLRDMHVHLHIDVPFDWKTDSLSDHEKGGQRTVD